MDDEDKYRRYANIPIPTYDEAIRPSSSQNIRGPHEISDDAERQGLLGADGTEPRSTYRPPTAESPRSSEDSDLRMPDPLDGDDDRRRVEELDYLDPNTPDTRQSGLYHRSRIRSKFSQQLSNLGATLSSIRLPSFRSLYTPVSVSTDAETPTTTTPPSRLSWLTRRTQSMPTVPEQYRISAPTAARLVGLMSIAILIYVLFILDVFPNNGRYMGTRFDPEQVRQYVQDHVDPARIEAYLAHITSYDHVAGTEGDLFLAEWMKEQWREQGNLDDIALLSYFVYLNYPKSGGRSVNLVKGKNRGWKAKLEEEIIDPFKQQTLAWHGHSYSGSAEGHLVYANGGGLADFAWLKENGVNLNGSIALMRYYGTQGDRALKIKAAENAGCIGALIYSDPSDDGSVKGPVWPDGPWRPDDSLQRGGVSLMSWVAGDPLTPGYGSTMDAKRLTHEESKGLVKIPSLPLAWRDAKVLLENLKGRGKLVPKDWVGGDKDFANDWYTGNDGADAPVVRMENDNDSNDQQQIWNLHGLIEGLEQPEKKVLIGNHRDSWCFGSVDPGSGSAVMMEMVRIFGELRSLGWRPLRTIEFVSWDAEEYNLVGSTEYVEDNIDYLRQNAVAYINVDVGVYGPDPVFHAAGSPLWQRALLHVIDRVSVPDGSKTLRKIWDEGGSRLEGLGAGSDYVAFQDMAGTTSIDFGFQGAAHGFPYHSCYETFDWVKKFSDPDFSWHRTLAQVWALLIIEVADRPLLPFDMRTYASAIGGAYTDALQQYAEDQFKKLGSKGSKELKDTGFDTASLKEVAEKLNDVAEHFHRFEDHWTANVLGTGGLESTQFAIRRMEYNNALTKFETDLLDLPTGSKDKEPHGVPGREQFKHVIFGPQTWSGYDEAFFPAVRDALDVGNFTGAQTQLEKVVRILNKATENLKNA
ncbi:putative glutamate carboxypeptidase [Pseudocercospora fuligena]|uniref:Putative glutamate carboxypeptidase n=1 Tax=Pseudocercospora fuligena TaxID=685502 RepID=A0A8H6RVE1_9PEZI|nr:putative glutamate carboxypeptidase [Pseudocercospora fuligena]